MLPGPTTRHPGPRTATRPPAVLLLGAGGDPNSGGLERYVEGLHRALGPVLAERHTVVLGHEGGHAVDGLVRAGRITWPLPARLCAFWRAAARAGRRAEVVDAHFALYALGPVVLGGLRRRPLVVHFHGPWAAESRTAGTASRAGLVARRAVERSVYRRAVSVVVMSSAFRRLLVEDYRVDPWSVSVLPPGVDLDRFTPGARAEARRRLGLDDEAWVAVAARRLVPRMGLDVLIAAWPAVMDSGSHAVLLVVGDGPDREGLEDLAARAARAGGQARKNGEVRFLGRVDDASLVDCYRAADVSVLPSRSLEGFGLAALESLACGTPAIVSDVGGLPEAVAPLGPSMVVPAGDVAALAARLVDARSGARGLPGKQECRDYAESFGWLQVARRHAEVYSGAARPVPRRRPRVVYLDHCPHLSGAEIALLRLLPSLADEVDAHVILAAEGRFARALVTAGVSVEVLGLPEWARNLSRRPARPAAAALGALAPAAGYVVRLAARLRHLAPDLVHANSLKACVYGSLASRLAGLPMVWHARDRLAADYLPGRTASAARALARSMPAAVIANSAETMSTLGPASSRPRPRRRVISDPCDPAPASARPAVPRSDHPLVFGMVGRLSPWKGQREFLDAFAAAFSNGEERAVLVGGALFGEEEYERSLHARVEALGLGERVSFIGFREDVAAELRKLDAVVHASVIPEPFGMVVVEGLAAGLPVIATDAGGPREVLSHAHDGLLVPPGNVAELARAMRLLADDEGLRRRLAEAGRRQAAEFHPRRIAAQVLDLYRDLGLPVGGGG